MIVGLIFDRHSLTQCSGLPLSISASFIGITSGVAIQYLLHALAYNLHGVDVRGPSQTLPLHIYCLVKVTMLQKYDKI